MPLRSTTVPSLRLIIEFIFFTASLERLLFKVCLQARYMGNWRKTGNQNRSPFSTYETGLFKLDQPKYIKHIYLGWFADWRPGLLCIPIGGVSFSGSYRWSTTSQGYYLYHQAFSSVKSQTCSDRVLFLTTAPVDKQFYQPLEHNRIWRPDVRLLVSGCHFDWRHLRLFL